MVRVDVKGSALRTTRLGDGVNVDQVQFTDRLGIRDTGLMP